MSSWLPLYQPCDHFSFFSSQIITGYADTASTSTLPQDTDMVSLNATTLRLRYVGDAGMASPTLKMSASGVGLPGVADMASSHANTTTFPLEMLIWHIQYKYNCFSWRC